MKMSEQKIFTVKELSPKLIGAFENYANVHGREICANKWKEHLAEPQPKTWISAAHAQYNLEHHVINEYYEHLGLKEDALKWAAFKLGLRESVTPALHTLILAGARLLSRLFKIFVAGFFTLIYAVAAWSLGIVSYPADVLINKKHIKKIIKHGQQKGI